MKLDKKQWLGIIAGLLILVTGFFLLRGEKMFYFIVVIALVIMIIPFLISFLFEQGKQRQKEEMFLAFTRDLVENVRSGTPISRAILNLRGREYGALTEHISKLANQIAIGIPLTNALRTFAKETKSNVIARAVGLISEAERAGGKIDTILESVASSVNQIEEIRKERKSAVYNLVVQGYIIFIVFIIIMLVLEFKILPMTSGLADVGTGLDIKVNPASPASFSLPMFIMLLVQSFFAGLVIGKISEGTLKSGIKHSFILLALTLLIKSGANAFFG